MDHQDQLVQKESEGLLGCRDFQERQDFRVCPGRMVLQAPEECQDAMEQRVREVSQEVQGSPELRESRVHLVCRDQRETQAM